MSTPNEEIFHRLMAAGKIKIQQGRLFNAALTPKPADFDFAKVEGMLLGIAIANATSPFGPVDVLFGLLAEGTAYALVVWGPWKKLGILWKAVILSLSVALFIGVELSMMVGAPFWLTSAGLFVGTFLAVELGNLMISKTALAKVV